MCRSGAGQLEIDWGDNSDTETVLLADTPQLLTHTFDNKVRDRRRIRWFTDACFRSIDWSGLKPRSLVLVQTLPVEELTLTHATLSLESLRLLSGTYSLNLSNCALADLAPLAECRELMTLDLSAARLKPTVIDHYLTTLVEHYGDRRNCTVIYLQPRREPIGSRTGIPKRGATVSPRAWKPYGSSCTRRPGMRVARGNSLSTI